MANPIKTTSPVMEAAINNPLLSCFITTTLPVEWVTGLACWFCVCSFMLVTALFSFSFNSFIWEKSFALTEAPGASSDWFAVASNVMLMRSASSFSSGNKAINCSIFPASSGGSIPIT